VTVKRDSHLQSRAVTLSKSFFERPILNSPYEYPGRHWKLDRDGLPTSEIIESRRTAEFISPVPAPKAQTGKPTQLRLALGEKELSTAEQQYNPYPVINTIRQEVDRWRKLPERQWKVTPETARLLRYWRSHQFSNLRPFFCQIEAAETAIWLVEVAGALRDSGMNLPPRLRGIWNHLHDANAIANPELLRVALKMATGAGKTTVMAMLIAWQTVNAVRLTVRTTSPVGSLTPSTTARVSSSATPTFPAPAPIPTRPSRRPSRRRSTRKLGRPFAATSPAPSRNPPQAASPSRSSTTSATR